MGIMTKKDIENYSPSVKEWMNYGFDITWDGYTIMKNHGNYIEINFPSSAAKGHDSYNLYFDEKGVLYMADGHKGNAGFVGKRYFNNK